MNERRCCDGMDERCTERDDDEDCPACVARLEVEAAYWGALYRATPPEVRALDFGPEYLAEHPGLVCRLGLGGLDE